MDINVSQTLADNALLPDEEPTMEKLLETYKKQKRECWLCDKIVKDLESGKEISDDNKWHFSSCVLSWEHIHFIH